MKKLSPLRLTSLITLMLFIGLASYPMMIWMEWKQEQEILGVYTGEDGSEFEEYELDTPERYSAIAELMPPSLATYFSRVGTLGFESKENVSSKKLKMLTELKDLHCIYLFESVELTEEIQQYLGYLNLETLWIGDESVTDEDVKFIRHYDQLSSLGLESTNLSDDTLIILAQLSSLKHVHLHAPSKKKKPFSETAIQAIKGNGAKVSIRANSMNGWPGS